MGRHADPPLEDLLRAANRGDARAYGAFLTAVTPIIRAVARARGGGLGPETCEDVVQETLLAIHDKRRTWREDAPLRPWLFAIVRHKVVDTFRARGARVHVDIDDFAGALAAEPEPDPTERADAERMIARLDPRSARIVRAIGLDGASVPEVGASLGMSEGAVRVALHRALRRLASLRREMVE
ncbi:sigma-70 family RNA polymerase sigma factor [Amaricoccus sp.]|uniref:sigma-70 family RNA polymerase sigma factor n=1 Tax=Amaricoccus sp. TaxID=1872485 RepID=UPI001B560268|nr:sigma-70 family RNA polymerase sigma factor [Amaricoccus sp.]MBP7242817.1 sigma-70 family RNA polymerase sigma factor [Amaricoccus sp.]